MKKILKYLFIVQEVSNKNREVKVGRGFSTAYRFNPYNPITYIALILLLVVGIILFGFYGIWKQTDNTNPFKWN